MRQHLAVEHPGLQDVPDQADDPPVAHPFTNTVEYEIESQPVKEGLNIGVHHPYPPLAYRLPHGLQGLMRRSLGPKPEATRQEVGLQDGLEHNPEGRLDHPVANRSDTERTKFCLPWFGYPDPPHRLGTVGAVQQPGLDHVEEPLDAGGLDVSDGDDVDTRSTLVGAHLQPRPPENVPAEDPVVKSVEPSIRRPLGRLVKLVL